MPAAHWLPFAASAAKSGESPECDVNGYFTVQEKSATFRGRNLIGAEVDLGPFDLFCGNEKVCKLVVWNHDDQPLRSDVVPQAINVASLQQVLGSSSGIKPLS
jgi:hypothetical protein